MNNVYSLFKFFNENDLLEIKLNEEWDFINKFIIIEALQTHSGKSKPQYFDSKRFEKYKDKIIYILIESLDNIIAKYPSFLSPDFAHNHQHFHEERKLCWARENIQTNIGVMFMQSLGLSDSDQIIFGDLDEIISNQVMHSLEKQDPHSIYGFELKTYTYKLNIFFKHMVGPLITSFAQYKKYLPSEMRSKCMGFGHIIRNAGWHFNGLSKNHDNLRKKYSSFSHSEDPYWSDLSVLNDEELFRKVLISYIPSFFIDPYQHIHPIDDKYPAYIQLNQHLLKDYFYI